ncbi:MAG: amidohydrolase [Acidobacteria bacterium]|nr:amidohydrolase [Acidobacteriota bacterium]
MHRTFFMLTATLWIAVAAFGQLRTATVPDEIFYNGKIVTVDGSFSIQQALAVRGEEILAVGSSAEVRQLAGPATRLTDLNGRTVIPGLMDNHNHQYNSAWIAYRGVDLNGVKTKQEMLDRIRRDVARAKPGEPVITNIGWAATPGIAPPTRQELDEISPDRIVVVMRARGTAYLNSTALKAAGITRNTVMVGGNLIPKDVSGEPTGQIGPPNTVNNVVPAIVPWPPVDEQIAMIGKMQEQQLALGLTSIREVELKPEGMRAYQQMRRQGKLKMRISMGLDVQATDWDKLDDILSPLGAGPGFGDHWLRLDSVSEFAVDSNLNVALFREPKLNPAGELGTMRITPDQIQQAMITINKYGWRPAIHITGDGTLDKVLDAYEAANAVSSIVGKRWVVEHIPYVQPDQMERLAKLGVLVSAQIQAHGGTAGAARALGEARANRMVPIRELLDHKIVVSAGSDWPGETNNPFVILQFYITRQSEDGKLAGPEQKITRQEALRMATVNNAYFTFEEDVKGSLEPGKLADFLILSDDILTVPEDKIEQIKPLAVYVGGKKMYAAPSGGF